MKLFGSHASPYVRRVRLILKDRKYEFIPVSIFTEDGQQLIAPYSKARRIPILVDDKNTIFDSYLICEYLLNRNMSLSEKKDLILINEANDSGITLFQLKKFELDPKYLNQFSRNQLAIIESILTSFNDREGIPWEITGMWLYSMLDWFSFREVYSWEEKYTNLRKFMVAHKKYDYVESTDPRKS